MSSDSAEPTRIARLVAVLAGIVGLALCVLVPLLPVKQTTATILWPQAPRADGLVGDITARDLQKKDGQWTRAKGMDTFCPVGPVLVTDLPAQALSLSGRVNGELRQHGSTADMIFPIPALIAYISRVITLEPGDLLVTGTPPGVGPLVAGDTLEISVPEIGTLRVSVVAPAP